MSFKVGETVVYPHHGAAVIEAIESRNIKGVERKYLVLRVKQGDLTVRVPADNVELVGVRDVVNAEGFKEFLTYYVNHIQKNQQIGQEDTRQI